MPITCWDNQAKGCPWQQPTNIQALRFNYAVDSRTPDTTQLTRICSSSGKQMYLTLTTQPVSHSMIHSLVTCDAMTTKHQKSPRRDCTVYSNAATCRQSDVLVCFQGQPGQATMIKSVHQLSTVLQAANLILCQYILPDMCCLFPGFFQRLPCPVCLVNPPNVSEVHQQQAAGITEDTFQQPHASAAQPCQC